MGPLGGQQSLDALLAEQLAYYRALAPEYSETAIPGLPTRDLAKARVLAELENFRPEGEVLELACGPGTWTQVLLRHAARVTAVDGAPEVLRLAAREVKDPRVRFVQADIFDWKPRRRYDAVGVGHAGRYTHKRAGADLMRVVAYPHRQRTVQHVEHVVHALMAVRRRPGKPGV